MADVRLRPTRRQLQGLWAYIAGGSITGAAHERDIAESTARQHLSALDRRLGCANGAQAAYLLGRLEPGDPSRGLPPWVSSMSVRGRPRAPSAR